MEPNRFASKNECVRVSKSVANAENAALRCAQRRAVEWTNERKGDVDGCNADIVVEIFDGR